MQPFATTDTAGGGVQGIMKQLNKTNKKTHRHRHQRLQGAAATRSTVISVFSGHGPARETHKEPGQQRLSHTTLALLWLATQFSRNKARTAAPYLFFSVVAWGGGELTRVGCVVLSGGERVPFFFLGVLLFHDDDDVCGGKFGKKNKYQAVKFS